MNSDKLHHPSDPPQNKNTSRVKKLGEVGLGGLPHCIKKPAPFTLIRSPKSTYTERQHKGQGKGQHIIRLCCSHGRTSEKGTGTQKETQFACLNYLINRKLINSSHTQGNSEGTQIGTQMIMQMVMQTISQMIMQNRNK